MELWRIWLYYRFAWCSPQLVDLWTTNVSVRMSGCAVATWHWRYKRYVSAALCGRCSERVRRCAAVLLLRPRARDSHPSMDRLRREVFRSHDADGSAHEGSGARLHFAHLVYAGEIKAGGHDQETLTGTARSLFDFGRAIAFRLQPRE